MTTLRTSIARLQGFLSETTDVNQIASLESELTRREAELESIESQRRVLTDQVALSTISVDFDARTRLRSRRRGRAAGFPGRARGRLGHRTHDRRGRGDDRRVPRPAAAARRRSGADRVVAAAASTPSERRGRPRLRSDPPVLQRRSVRFWFIDPQHSPSARQGMPPRRLRTARLALVVGPRSQRPAPAARASGTADADVVLRLQAEDLSTLQRTRRSPDERRHLGRHAGGEETTAPDETTLEFSLPGQNLDVASAR